MAGLGARPTVDHHHVGGEVVAGYDPSMAVLDSSGCKGLARHVAMAWLGNATEHHGAVKKRDRFSHLYDELAEEGRDWTCEIKTQRSIRTADGQLRRPDLELVFTDANTQRVDLLIEVKHGSAPHTRQLRAYVDDQGGTDDAAVLLLAPRNDFAWFAEDQIPDEVARVRWQDTARAIREWPTSDPVAEFLACELSEYLEGEGLVDPSHFTTMHLDALVQHRQALDALERVCELAAEGVANRWHGPADPGSYGRPVHQRWWGYPALPRGRDPRTDVGVQQILEHWGWGLELLLDSTVVFKEGMPWVPRLGAGMSGEAGSFGTLQGDQRDRLRAADFQLLPLGSTNSRTNEYVWRVAELKDVLTGGEIEAQADLLADWAVKAFTDLTEALRIDA